VAIGELFVELADVQYHRLELSPFAAQGLGTLGVTPDIGCFQLPQDLLEPFFALSEVKDTPSGHQDGLADRKSCCNKGSVPWRGSPHVVQAENRA